jgi:hypothetical protein
MLDPLQGVLLGEGKKVITVVCEEGTSLLTRVITLLSVRTTEPPGFAGCKRIIAPLAEILGQVRIDILVQVEADLVHYVGSTLRFPRLWATKRSVAGSYYRLKISPERFVRIMEDGLARTR